MPAKKTQRVKIGKSFFVPVLLKVIARNPDGSPRWLEIGGDEEKMDLEHGSREFYLVWGSELLAGRSRQAGVKAPPITVAGPPPALADTMDDDPDRCAVCGWPLAADIKSGCTRGNCAHRPRPATLYAPERAAKEAEDLLERALRNGMPPSGRWA